MPSTCIIINSTGAVRKKIFIDYFFFFYYVKICYCNTKIGPKNAPIVSMIDNIPTWLNKGIHKEPMITPNIPIITPEEVEFNLLGKKLVFLSHQTLYHS